MMRGFLSLEDLPDIENATTVLAQTAALLTTVVQPPTTTSPTTPPSTTTSPTTTQPEPTLPTNKSVLPAHYTNRTELLERAMDEGAMERTAFYVALALCLLQVLLVLGIRFARSCSCKSTVDQDPDGSRTSLLHDDTMRAADDDFKSSRTLRTTRL